jgi:hypothetical protein|tara:strand:- start:338 stop:532 length:195 start_codon:yes stop_codon:yes gene_type:complete
MKYSSLVKEFIKLHYGKPCEWYDAPSEDGGQCHTCKAWDAYTYLTEEKVHYKGVENWDEEGEEV